MARFDRHPNRPVSDHLHPMVYWIIIGLSAWLVVSVWGFLGSGYSGLVLTVVSLFILIAVTIPLLLWRIWRSRAGPTQADEDDTTFGDWLAQDFAAHSGPVKASRAAIEILLPIIAVAFGMTAFAIVLHLDVV